MVFGFLISHRLSAFFQVSDILQTFKTPYNIYCRYPVSISYRFSNNKELITFDYALYKQLINVIAFE